MYVCRHVLCLKMKSMSTQRQRHMLQSNQEVMTSKEKKVNMAFDTFVVFKSQHNKDVINLQICGCH